MCIAAKDSRDAEYEGRKQRLGFARLLRADESKSPTSADVLRIRRIMAAAAERSAAYDEMLSEATTQKLFDTGALYFARPGA